MVLVRGWVHLVVIHQPVSNCGTAERVEARTDNHPDVGGVDVELIDRPHRIAEELLLYRERATLNGGGEELLGSGSAGAGVPRSG